MILIFIVLTLLGIAAIAIAITIHNIKKKIVPVILPLPEKNNRPDPTIKPQDLEPAIPNIIVNDYKLFEQFISEYNPSHNLNHFNELNFRKGAGNTCAFGLSEGYRYKNGKMIWGYVRIHSGTDRAGGGTVGEVKDIVMSPFNFEKSKIQDFGDRSYGTLISLFNDKFEFELRIAHMHPTKNIIPWTLGELKAGRPIKKDWFIGSAGTYGASTGNHTHTELRSYDEKCEVFEILLEEKFGDKVLKEYTTNQILKYYKTQKYFKEATDKVILQDWNQLKKNKEIIFINKYLFRRVYYGKVYTWYNTWQLFGM